MASPSILLVEDNEDNRALIRQVAELVEVALFEAHNGLEGVQLAREIVPTVILMDLSLPVMTGWEATAMLKSDPATSAVPIIALTAHAMEGDEARAREAGCDGFVTKPIHLQNLMAVIESYLTRAAG